MTTARVKNWAEFQHYKDRSPPWIKLHRGLLDDFNYSSLPLASKALAPLVWLLAAETQEGSVSVDPAFLAFRLRWNEKDVRAGLTPLIEKGFLIVASGVLADCQQVATPERETEAERETEKTLSADALGFDDFWKIYPNKKGVSEARKKWASRKLDPKTASIIADVKARIAGDPDWQRGAIPHGSTYVNQERWLDALTPDALPVAPTAAAIGASPAKVETGADKIAAALAAAEVAVASGTWTKDYAKTYMAEVRAKHG